MAKNWKSDKLRKGILLVLLELIAIIFAGILDRLVSLDFLVITTKTLFVFKESISNKKNLKEMGIGLLKDITDAIETINPNKEDKEE